MTANFATNMLLLTDVHGLQSEGIRHTNVARHCGKFFCVTECFKNGIKVVHSVSNFVDADFFGLTQDSLLIKCLFFKETVDASGRVNELLVGMSGLFVGGEHTAVTLGVKGCQDFFGSSLEFMAGLMRSEIGNHQKPIAVVIGNLLFS